MCDPGISIAVMILTPIIKKKIILRKQELQKLLAIDMKFKVINEIQAPCQWLLRINLSFIPTV